MNRAFLDHYRCPEQFAGFVLVGKLSEDSGYFRFGHDTICFGQSSRGFRARVITDGLYDVLEDVTAEGPTVWLPFDSTQIIDNLRYERYLTNSHAGGKSVVLRTPLTKAYYFLRQIMPVPVRRHIQRTYFRGWQEIPFPHWPVDRSVEHILEKLLIFSLKAHRVGGIPFIWFWPEGAPSCLIMTHDVETASGRDFSYTLMDMDDSFGIKASFQIVPEQRYRISDRFLNSIRERGFEINVHDLNHDGSLFIDREHFLRCARKINQYVREFSAVGFRSGVLYRNLDWYDALDFSYDMSVPNVGHLEAQRGGCCTVMPYFIGKILELPLTTTQDYSLFRILGNYSIDLWKRQIDLITEKNGLISFVTHPDYLIEKRARDTYVMLLDYLARLRSERKVWVALPKDVDCWWRERSQMKLIREGNTWRIEGPSKERARIAYASLDGDRLVYGIAPSS